MVLHLAGPLRWMTTMTMIAWTFRQLSMLRPYGYVLNWFGLVTHWCVLKVFISNWVNQLPKSTDVGAVFGQTDFGSSENVLDYTGVELLVSGKCH